MKKKEADPLQIFGGTSLLMVFAVLCLTVFAMLSLSTVQAQKRLSDSSLETMTAYYKADLEAETLLARLRSGELPEQVKAENNRYSYRCSISEQQHLYVEVKEEKGKWTILRWQVVAEPIAIDDSLPVWQGKGGDHS